MVQGSSERIARVGAWWPVDRGMKTGDVAVLELIESERDIDPEVGFVTFANVTGRTIDHDDLRVYGIAAGESTGQHLPSRFIGYARSAVVQVDSVAKSGELIRPGFSGAAIFNEREQAVVGMIQGVKIDAASGTMEQTSAAALALATVQLAALAGKLHVEERRRPAWFSMVWSLVSVALLIASVSHLWVSQGGKGVVAMLALESMHLQLAAFLGMHFIALVGPFVAWMLCLYSRDFSMSDWSQRIPPFPFCRETGLPGPRLFMSTVVVALFVLVPFYAQVHFLRKFHGEGYVFANVKAFGDAAWLAVPQRECVRRDEFCKHPEAGRYTLMTLSSGARGGYFNDVYVYGEHRDDASSEALTYFPLWQPLAVILLSGLATLLLVRWGSALVWRRPGGIVASTHPPDRR